jgi:hypothetical protein
MGEPIAEIRSATVRLFGIRSGDLETPMHGSIAERPVAAIANTAKERFVAAPTRLWARLNSAWLRRMNARVAHDVRALDHSGVLADFERAARGSPCAGHSERERVRWPIRDSRPLVT